MKKIGFILYSLSMGGTAKNAISLCLFPRKKKIITEIILLKNENDYRKETNNLTIHTLSQQIKRTPLPLVPLSLLIMAIRLRKIAREKNFDLLLGIHEFQPYYLTVLLSRLLGIKSVLTVVSPLSEQLERKPFYDRFISKILLKLSLKTCNKIICVSQGVAFDIRRNFLIPKEKIEIIHNPVDLLAVKQKRSLAIPESRLPFPLSAKDRVILYCGSFREEKGIFHLMRAFRYIKDKELNTKLILIGKGPMKKELKLLAKDLDLTGDCFFINFTANPFIFFNMADLFILPSLYEGFAKVLIEAMACGLPVIATDCPYGSREAICSTQPKYPLPPTKSITYCRYGVLVPPFNKKGLGLDGNFEKSISPEEKKLAQATIILLKNTKLRNQYKKMSLKRAKDFSLEKIGEEYYKVIKTVVINSAK